MLDLNALLSEGTANPLVLIPMALLLGALHGLEPGHSKTMMAAFIIATRGTVWQAALLGLSAAISHTAIVWILALLALKYGEALIGEDLEPWFMIASGVLILIIALWIYIQTRRAETASARTAHHHHHDHPRGGELAYAHAHDHPHSHDHSHAHDHDHVHTHHRARLAHDHVQNHGSHGDALGDAHARAHAAEIESRFGASGRTTTLQTVLFGLTGGLIPCSAAITVLIICLNLNRFWLGVGLVGAFSAGLALTLVAAGVVAALGVNFVSKRSSHLDGFFRRAPYISAAVIAILGLLMIYSGWAHFGHTHAA